MKLLILSDTPIYKVNKGYVIFEPTLREVEYLSEIFDEIVWYGMVRGSDAPSSVYRLPANSKITIRPLPKAVGGNSVWKKLAIIPQLPMLLWIIGLQFSRYDYIHTRGPSLPALVGIMYSKIFKSKSIWHKYAGNWNQEDPPLSYRIQRSILKKSQHPVTVNGFWNDSNGKILSFENPCFSKAELEAAVMNSVQDFSAKNYKFLFVGRLEKEKGAYHVVEAARSSSPDYTWYLVGEGKDHEEIIRAASGLDNVHFLGPLSRNQLNEIYQQAHFFILPTIASEGFPKVISEACGHGCIPIVSQVSSIGQYVESDFGFLLQEVSGKSIAESIQQIMDRQNELALMSQKAITFAQLFTYERYVDRIKREVFDLA